MTVETTSTAVAGAAVTSPWWLPSFHTVSGVVAEIVPILGAVYLVLQIAAKVIEIRRKARRAME